MIDCLIVVWLIEWNSKLLKVKWEGIKGLSQTFTFFLLIPVNSNSFHHKTLERRWHDFFHLFKWHGVLKIFEFHLENISNSETLRNSMTHGESWGFRYFHIWVFSNVENRIIWFYLFYHQLFLSQKYERGNKMTFPK